MSKFIKPQIILRIALKIKLYLILVFSFFQGYGQNTSKHNILFIAIDDMRPYLASYGSTQLKTPHLDKLASESIQFENAYCNIAVCGASRASIMTGVRPNQKRFAKYYSTASKDLPGAVSLQGLFKKNGYTTVSYGKIYHNPSDFQEDWSELDDTHEQFDYQSVASLEIIKTLPKGRVKGPAFEVADVSDETYSDGITTKKAIKRLKKFKKSKKPFFLAVGYVSPHLPFIQPKKYWDMYSEKDIKLADNPFQPKNSPKQAVHNSPELRGMYTGIPKQGPLPLTLAKNLVHGYYASVSYTDALIGKLICTLEDLGLRENTTIILWGDHGFFLGEHGMWTKHSTLKEAIHVPLLVSSPGVTPAKTKAMTEYVDIYPSLCELAGVKAPSYLHGTSFVPVLKNPTSQVKNEIYTRYARGEAVLDADFSYTEFVNKNGVPGACMLFDMLKDPNQNTDVSKRPTYKDIVKKYRNKLKKMRTEMDNDPF
ncbi:MAG: sulfatase [Flavicella sp.]